MLKASEAKLILSAADPKQFPETTQPEFLMVGKSNVGKSSLINAITNRKRLAYVGQRPGKTRLINFFHINDDLLLVDVPGYGYANRSHQEQLDYATLMDAYFELRHPRAMLLVIDIRRGMGEDDWMMLDFAQAKNIEAAIVLSKADKLSRNKMMSMKMKTERDTGLEVFLFSTLNAHHTPEIQKFILRSMD